MRWVSRTNLILAVTVGCLAGCQAYRPHPLTAAGVDKELSGPSLDRLSVLASKLRHPLLPAITVNLSDGLSPDEAAVIAVLANPSLRAVRDRRHLADAQLLQAGLLPNPQLSASLEPVTGGATAGTFTAYGYGVSWDLRALLTRRARLAGAKANRSAVDLDVAWQEWQIAQAAKLATFNLISLQDQVTLARQMKDRLGENLSVVRKAVGAGLMTQQELAAAEAASNQAQANLVDLRKQFRQQQLTLNQALGLPAGAAISLQKGITMPSQVKIPSLQAILSGLQDRRLDLVALRKGYQSQESAVRLAVLEQFPNINVGVSQASDTSNVISMPFTVSVDLPIFDRNQAAIAEQRATRRQLYDEYVNRVFEARSEIARLTANADGIAEQIRVANQAVPSLQRLVETYRQAVSQGQADVLSYYTAWNDLTAKRLEILTLKQKLVETRIGLEIAAGAYDLQSLGHGRPTTQPTTREVNQ